MKVMLKLVGEGEDDDETVAPPLFFSWGYHFIENVTQMVASMHVWSISRQFILNRYSNTRLLKAFL